MWSGSRNPRMSTTVWGKPTWRAGSSRRRSRTTSARSSSIRRTKTADPRSSGSASGWRNPRSAAQRAKLGQWRWMGVPGPARRGRDGTGRPPDPSGGLGSDLDVSAHRVRTEVRIRHGGGVAEGLVRRFVAEAGDRAKVGRCAHTLPIVDRLEPDEAARRERRVVAELDQPAPLGAVAGHRRDIGPVLEYRCVVDHQAGHRALEDEALPEGPLFVAVVPADRAVGVALGGERQPVVDGKSEEARIGREVVAARSGLHDRAAGQLQAGRPGRVAARRVGAARDQQGGAEDQGGMNETHARASLRNRFGWSTWRGGHRPPHVSLARAEPGGLEAKQDFGTQATGHVRMRFGSAWGADTCRSRWEARARGRASPEASTSPRRASRRAPYSSATSTSARSSASCWKALSTTSATGVAGTAVPGRS